MLHELLLSLSGHPSALFSAEADPQHASRTANRLLSPPEAELLSSIRHLSELHRKTRDHVARIATSHPSTICCAVATAIISSQLAAFQQDILNVETRILNQDASTVGAYNIVPLAAIASEFSRWVRLMNWLWDLGLFMLPTDSNKSHDACSGAKLVDKLRAEVQTGYPDIENAARHLSKIADSAWLRQLSPWLLHGRLPSFGVYDFFIHQEEGNDDDVVFRIHHDLLPKFVTRHTASSILFIGKSLNQVRLLPAASKAMNVASNVPDLDLLPEHVKLLSCVSAPVTTTDLSEAVASIRLSLSRNLLQYLLPREKIFETISILHQFFLVARGEFATNLIAEADARILARLHGPPSSKTGQSLKGLILKEAEVSQIMSRTMSILSMLSGQDDHADDVLEAASQLLHLSINDPHSNRPGTPGRAKDADSIFAQLSTVSFHEILLSMPTSLTMTINPPLDLFITKTDLGIYSLAHGYLLAIRRAQLHLTQLWTHTSIRRDHPCPPGYEYSNSIHGKTILKRRRQRLATRMRAMRKTWATCRAAIYFLAEVEAYFQGSIIQASFNHFQAWVNRVEDAGPADQKAPVSSDPDMRDPATNTTNFAQQDPEALAHAHRQFLASVLQGLLINDTIFTKVLRAFCTHVDELVAYITRLTRIQKSLDLEEDEGIDNFTQNYRTEEKEVSLELDRARKRLDSDLRNLVERLRNLDNERITGVSSLNLNNSDAQQAAYTPPRLGGIDQLLVKLDWGTEREEEPEDLL